MKPNSLLRTDSHARECKTIMTWMDTIVELSESVSGSSSSAKRYRAEESSACLIGCKSQSGKG